MYNSGMEVPVSQLRAELSSWIQRARDGEEIVITERGEPVARLAPAGVHEVIADLVAKGSVTPASRRGPRKDISNRELIVPTPGPPISDSIVAERDLKR